MIYTRQTHYFAPGFLFPGGVIGNSFNLQQEGSMQPCRTLKSVLAAIVTAAVISLAAQPALAADKPKGDKASQTTDAGPELKSQEEIDRILANGPPETLKSPPGLYVKIRGSKAGTTKIFKNGHPDNNSEWVYCPGGVCPYGQESPGAPEDRGTLKKFRQDQ